jgi:transposase
MAQRVLHAGIDVSKEWLDVAVAPTRETHRVRCDAAGLAELARWLDARAVERVALEASGGYERPVIDHLSAHGVTVAVLNPLRVRRFAEAKGRLAKTDRADALTIAQFLAVMEAPPRPGRRADLDPLTEPLTLRRRLCQWMVECDQQLEHLRDPQLRRSVTLMRAGFARRVAMLDRTLAARVAARAEWRELSRRLQSVPGVGPVLAHTLIGLVPELGRLSRRAIASLIGLAPFDDRSGKRDGERHIKAGRDAVRAVLYMATLVAKRHNPVIAAFAARLAGKKPKVIVIACARKLLVRLNAMLRDGHDWNPHTA